MRSAPRRDDDLGEEHEVVARWHRSPHDVKPPDPGERIRAAKRSVGQHLLGRESGCGHRRAVSLEDDDRLFLCVGDGVLHPLADDLVDDGLELGLIGQDRVPVAGAGVLRHGHVLREPNAGLHVGQSLVLARYRQKLVTGS